MEGSTSDEKKKEWRKKMKELQKERKKLKKEEEHKKNLLSKDSKVVIIDKKTFEDFRKKTKEKRKSEEASGPINLNDFPALKVDPEKPEVEVQTERRRTSKLTRTSWNRLPIAETLKNDTSIDTFPSLESTFNKSKRKAGNAREAPAQSSESADIPPPEVPKPKKVTIVKPPSLPEEEQLGKRSKKKKHKDPVVLNLNEIIIAKSAKKDKKSQVLGSKYRKRSEREILSGNILDSANPKRKKGKHRENKKQRISNLKVRIIKDRIIKAKIREKAVELAFKNSDVDFDEEIDFKTEVVKYLERLKELKPNLRKKKSEESPDTSKIQPSSLLSGATITDKPYSSAVKDVKNLSSNSTSTVEISLSDSIVEKPLNLPAANIKNNSSCATKKKFNPQPSDKSAEKRSNETTKLQRFSSKFRDYCENALTPSLDAAVKELIKEIVYLQDRMFARDPIKARAKRRHVIGFREAKKYLSLKKVKMLIIAPDLEKSESKDSISDLVNDLKEHSAAQNIPYVFALDRRKLGYSSKKKVPISVFAILNYEGTEAKFVSVMENFAQAKELFEKSPLASKKVEEISEPPVSIVDDVTSRLASAFISVLSEKKYDSDMHDEEEEEEDVNPFLRALSHCDKN